MNKIAILTDSNSGITQEQARELELFVLPMPFYISGKMFFEGINLSQEDFYKKLEEDAEISTSQPSIGEITDEFERLLKEYEQVVFIPMSSGLSGTCQTGTMIAQDYDGRVQVVDNQRISVTLRQSVLDAKQLADSGKTAQEIKEILECEKMESSIYITLETLKYLKKGGRITPAAATIGTILNLKPVLQIQGEKLDAYAKARGKSSAKKIMLKAMRADLNGRFKDAFEQKQMHIAAAYTGNIEEAQEWKRELEKTFPQYEIHMDPLSLSISCHIGYGALAIACSKVVSDK